MKDISFTWSTSHQNSSKIDDNSKILAMYATVLRFFWTNQMKHTVDGRNPANQLTGSWCHHYAQGFIHPGWCRISSINSSAGLNTSRHVVHQWHWRTFDKWCRSDENRFWDWGPCIPRLLKPQISWPTFAWPIKWLYIWLYSRYYYQLYNPYLCVYI